MLCKTNIMVYPNQLLIEATQVSAFLRLFIKTVFFSTDIGTMNRKYPPSFSISFASYHF